MRGLGRALAASPTVLLLDEPSAGLDSSETERFEGTLGRVSRERAISVLLVEHDVELVMRMCSTVYVLDFGIMIASGSPQAVPANPAGGAAYLGEELPDGKAQQSDERAPGSGLSGPSISASTPGPPTEPSDGGGQSAVLAVDNLSVRYGEATALSGVSFEVGAGKALAVLGANGAGKSSLARALSGLVLPSGGRIVFAGEEIRGRPAYRLRRARRVRLPESR